MNKEKILVFDMDGTIADLYHVNNWLEALKAENPEPYKIASPLYDMGLLEALLVILKKRGWKVIVVSWLAKNASNRYNSLVTTAKIDWLQKYNFPYDELHIVPYGTPKTECTASLKGYQILIDDNPDVRKNWHLGDTFNANKNVIDFLFTLLEC